MRTTNVTTSTIYPSSCLTDEERKIRQNQTREAFTTFLNEKKPIMKVIVQEAVQETINVVAPLGGEVIKTMVKSSTPMPESIVDPTVDASIQLSVTLGPKLAAPCIDCSIDKITELSVTLVPKCSAICGSLQSRSFSSSFS